MSADLYPDRMLQLAERGDAGARLASPHASVTVDNPLCGDRVTVDVSRGSDGRVVELGHAVRGCVLCRAATAVLGRHAQGLGRDDLGALRERLRAALRSQGEMPADAPWDELAVFAPVARHRSRHECVLLPFDAVIEALGKR